MQATDAQIVRFSHGGLSYGEIWCVLRPLVTTVNESDVDPGNKNQTLPAAGALPHQAPLSVTL